MSSSLQVVFSSPCAEVDRVVNLLAVVPLEVSVVSVKSLELNRKVSFLPRLQKLMIKFKVLTSFMALASQPFL